MSPSVFRGGLFAFNKSCSSYSTYKEPIFTIVGRRNSRTISTSTRTMSGVSSSVTKVVTPEFNKLFTPELEKLAEIFSINGYDLRIAGGAVRDLLLGESPHDIDFATIATPQEMVAMFEKEQIRMINNKGEKHGTITCRINEKENFEVTTLRVDAKTDGRHAEVVFTTDWIKDAERRDLTINSMFLGFDGTLYDYFNGKQDLMERRVRFVGDATARIQEDYLRILRYFRFYGRISTEPNKHEQETLNAINRNTNGLKMISGERIWVELKKIATGRHVDFIFKAMNDNKVLDNLGFTGDLQLDNLSEVWRRCRDMEPLPMTLIPALFASDDQLKALHNRVKMSRDELQLGTFILEHRDDKILSTNVEHKTADSPGSKSLDNSNASGESREAKKMKIEKINGMEEKIKFEGESENDLKCNEASRLSFERCQDLLVESQYDVEKTRQRALELLKYLNLRDVYEQIRCWVPNKFPVSGLRLLEMGVPKGPQFLKELNRLRHIWKQSRFTKTEEELVGHLNYKKPEEIGKSNA